MPGQKTAIGIRLTKVNRLAAPFTSNCYDDFPDDYAPFAPMDNAYSEDNCNLACEGYHAHDRCNCYERYDVEMFRNSSHWIGQKVDELCLKFETKNPCLEDVKDEIAAKTIECDCQPPCEETFYGMTM